MLRYVLFACGAAIALYLVSNLVQLMIGSYKDRRAVKDKKGGAR